MSTEFPSKAGIKRQWHVLDGENVVLGKLASRAAMLLMGKHKPSYTPFLDTGDHVIVVNAARVRVTGGKLDGKTYTRYSGYPGGLKERSLREALEQDPTFPVYNAVRGMLQRNTLGADMLKRLRVYAGAEHGHAAQKPTPIAFDQRGDMRIGG